VTFFFLYYLYGSDSRGSEADYDSYGSYDNGPSVVETNVTVALVGQRQRQLRVQDLRNFSDAGHAVKVKLGWRTSLTHWILREIFSRQGGWGKRLLGIGAIGGAAMMIKGTSSLGNTRYRLASTETREKIHDSLKED